MAQPACRGAPYGSWSIGNRRVKRIALVGAGYIAGVHADALRDMREVQITAIVDPAGAAAAALARQCPGAAVFASVDAALAAEAFDRAHVLVPPELHAPVAATLIAAGKPTLLEKPLAATGAECAALVAQAAAADVPLGVNQNFVHHPAFVRLRRLVDARAMGRPSYVDVLYNVPLRQLAARQFGHWMFAAPGNILLEQAVHPLSQIAALAGAIGEVRAIAAPPIALSPDRLFHAAVDVALACAQVPAQLRFAVGQSFPFWQVRVVCDDGVIVADILANRCVTYGRTRWMDAVDGALSGTRSAAALARDSLGGTLGYVASLLHLRPPQRPVLRQHAGDDRRVPRRGGCGQPPALDAAFGAMLVAACERIRTRRLCRAPRAGRGGHPPERSGGQAGHRHSWRHRFHRHPSRPPLPGGEHVRHGDGPLGARAAGRIQRSPRARGARRHPRSRRGCARDRRRAAGGESGAWRRRRIV